MTSKTSRVLSAGSFADSRARSPSKLQLKPRRASRKQRDPALPRRRDEPPVLRKWASSSPAQMSS
eukprot:9484456-Pyramimonas_sp.AAC.2